MPCRRMNIKMSENALQNALAEVVDDVRKHLLWQMEEGATHLFSSGIVASQSNGSLRDKVMQRVVPVAPEVVAKAPAEVEVVRKPLDEIRRELGNCTRCKLCEGRKQIVFGTGNPKAELLFVGEGPGSDEDAQGIPFVGAAGQLLTKMIEAMGFTRDQVYICNVVKCRPPNNRTPEPSEISTCLPFLKAQISSVGPKAIVALGKVAAQTLLKKETPITQLRGVWCNYEGIPMMPTFHTAYLLRQPAEKKKVWSDLQQVMKMFGK